MKPDVLKQIAEIEKHRAKMQKQSQQGNIMVQTPGQEPVSLTQEQVLQHLNEQNKKMNELVLILQQRDKTIQELQQQNMGKPLYPNISIETKLTGAAQRQRQGHNTFRTALSVSISSLQNSTCE